MRSRSATPTSHKTKQFSSSAPLNELAAIRKLSFPVPGEMLGGNPRRVFSQALVRGPAHPTDRRFVENVMWNESQVEFSRTQEVADRNVANRRWLGAAFAWAMRTGAGGVVVGLQADMWDPAALLLGGDGLDGYTELVKTLADTNSDTGRIHGTQEVKDLSRITVQGSTTHPSEWLRLTIDPRTPGVFSWENVVYRP